MKSTEVPKGVIVGVVAVVVIVIAILAYSTFFKPAPLTDPSKVSADRLLDPDRRGQ